MASMQHRVPGPEPAPTPRTGAAGAFGNPAHDAPLPPASRIPPGGPRLPGPEPRGPQISGITGNPTFLGAYLQGVALLAAGCLARSARGFWVAGQGCALAGRGASAGEPRAGRLTPGPESASRVPHHALARPCRVTAATHPEDADAAKRHFACALEPASNPDPLVAPRPGDDRR